MIGISLWEPWATAIALGLKTVETRSMRTHHRGRMVICAARTTLHAGFIFDPVAGPYFAGAGVTSTEQLCFGCAVAIVTVVDCVSSDELMGRTLVPGWVPLGERERVFGNYLPGRWGWILRDVRRLEKPVPVRGSQGFFQVSDALLHL